ncbi:ATP10 protein-domain-containing protein [Lipomyces doorenjongii]|uniref:ATP10 protein-domain-containing protein n=1 Tax=Lipomyces doorenjongii TaxID=383834 RepID=UPI0034CE4C6C
MNRKSAISAPSLLLNRRMSPARSSSALLSLVRLCAPYSSRPICQCVAFRHEWSRNYSSEQTPLPADAQSSSPISSGASSPSTQLPNPTRKPINNPDVAAALNALASSKKKDNNGNYLIRPIGMRSPPKPTDNTGIDKRTFAQKRADFVDYDKHIEKRRELVREFTKSYFSEMHQYKKNMGKEWIAPKMFFRADKALYMPNFYGTTLASRKATDTTSALKGNLSIVKIYSSVSGERQVNSYFDSPEKALADVREEEGYQIVDITIPESFVKAWISKFFQYRTKNVVGKTRHSKFFYAQKLPGQLNLAIGAANQYCGYVYLVDRDCKVRWAAGGYATAEEKDSMQRCLLGLVAEDRARQNKN